MTEMEYWKLSDPSSPTHGTVQKTFSAITYEAPDTETPEIMEFLSQGDIIEKVIEKNLRLWGKTPKSRFFELDIEQARCIAWMI